MEAEVVLSGRELEIISILSEVLELGPKQTVKEGLLSILSVVRKGHWTKYEFHEYNIAARSFIGICKKCDLQKRVPFELRALFPEHEAVEFDE